MEQLNPTRPATPELVSGEGSKCEGDQQLLNDRYRTLVENIDLGIGLIDRQYKIVASNSVLASMAGRSAPECTGQKCFGVSEKRESVCPHCPGTTAMRTGKPAEAETRTVRDDGSSRDLRIRAFPVLGPDGLAEGFIEVVEDISERKKAEELLRQSHDELQAIYTGIIEGLLITDIETKQIQRVNLSLCQMLGYSEEELMAMSIGDLHPPQALPDDLARFQAVVEGRVSINHDRPVLRKDGSLFYADITGHQIVYNKRPCLLALFRDTTERKRTAEDLAQAMKAAEAANRAKSEFLANMSHEIRTPMTAILGYVDLLLQEEGLEKAPPRRQQAFSSIKRNADHLLELINDILDLSRVEAGKVQLELTHCSPMGLLTDVVTLMRVRAEAKQLKLQADVIGPLPEKIFTDPLRLRQVLVNLVGNAVKFTDEGEIHITARLTSEQDSLRLCFEVTDTGIGMSQEQIGKLFQPFSQVDTSATRKFSGTGLGLCLSKRLAKAMGGDIEVRSCPGKGSTFTLTLDPGQLEGVRMIESDPERSVDRPPRPAATVPEKVKLRSRVLLAEDGPDNQILITAFLEDAGAKVTAVENGRLAVDAALAASQGATPFDVILMDMQMPVLDGYAATRELRARGYTAPVIALTAHAMVGDSQKCLDAGCNAYATKPINSRELLSTIAHWTANSTPAGPAMEDSMPASGTDESAETLQSLYIDHPLIGRLLPNFLDKLNDRVDALRDSLAQSEFEELRRLAHQLKGAGGSYGYPSISEAAQKLEYAARDGDREAASASLARVSALCRAAVFGREAPQESVAHCTLGEPG